MAFDYNKLKNNIVAAGKDVGAKAKEATNVAKIKMDICSKEDYLEKQYAELGKAYYAAHKDDEEVAEPACFKNIHDALAELDALNEELMDVQGSVICKNCGTKQSDEAKFCKNCGAPLS